MILTNMLQLKLNAKTKGLSKGKLSYIRKTGERERQRDKSVALC